MTERVGVVVPAAVHTAVLMGIGRRSGRSLSTGETVLAFVASVGAVLIPTVLVLWLTNSSLLGVSGGVANPEASGGGLGAGPGGRCDTDQLDFRHAFHRRQQHRSGKVARAEHAHAHRPGWARGAGRFRQTRLRPPGIPNPR